ncbi:MAG: hypothetical protein AAF745_08770 [Planctomycetota bacterium]
MVSRFVWFQTNAAVTLLIVMISTGCRQSGTSTAVAPMTTLPGQPAPVAMPGLQGPSLQGLNPFGSGVRVPPPATGAYGNSGVLGSPSGIASPVPSTAPMNYAPSSNYAPSTGVVPMSHNQIDGQIGSGVVTAGGVAPIASSSSSPSPSPFRGGMPVNDLTGSPPPPGYVSSGATGLSSPNLNAGVRPNTGIGTNTGIGPIGNALPGSLPATSLTPQTSNAASNGWRAVPAGSIRAF